MEDNTSTILSVEELTVRFRENSTKPILSDLSFDLFRGEVLGLIGASGAGKTLLSQYLIGLPPNAAITEHGKILFSLGHKNEINLSTADERALDQYRQSYVAKIFQNPGQALNPTLKIGRQLKFIHELNSQNPTSEVEINEVLKAMSFPDPKRILNSYPHQLSGGQLQRIVIAMAILKKAQILVADEPTTALDAELRYDILKLIKHLNQKYRMSIVYISHDLSVVQQIADRILELRNGQIHEYHMPGNHTFDMPDRQEEHLSPILKVRGLTKTYFQSGVFGLGKEKEYRALEQVSFDLRQGEVLGVIGASGSGKSTLGRVLVGLEDFESGKIMLGEHELGYETPQDLRHVRNIIQIVHQNPVQSLSPNLTIKQHLFEAIQLTEQPNDVDQKIMQIMDAVNLEQKLLDRYPHQISGGECQRVNLARVLCVRPKIIICDEITSALDQVNEEQILTLLQSLMSTFELSIILITHDLKVLAKMANRLIVLENGAIVEESGLSEFVKSPISKAGQRILAAFATMQ